MFADVELDRAAFGLGVVSLLSSLISIGFGTGLMYVLGDVEGHTLNKIGRRYPILFVFALSIPQVWAGICIVTFFLCTGIFAWNASDKGWTAKAGIIGSGLLTILHLLAFARLFHKQHKVETLIDDDEIDNGGMDHNIHIAQLVKNQKLYSEPGKSSDMNSSDSSSPDMNKRPGGADAQYVTQYGGSGVGHFVDSPPKVGRGDRPGPRALGKMKSGPLVDSPDPTSQEFVFNRSQGGSGERGLRRSPQQHEMETVPLGEVVNLFASTEGKISK
ncbi:hypothetical protein BDV93DRAFT_354731 [Ceratobasidium sp. AG-I]|nr:hypothetical protein BDV93DRAFT_354731 [Ceratobasidium sp. AG-I]